MKGSAKEGQIVTISGINITINGKTRELVLEYKNGKWIEIE